MKKKNKKIGELEKKINELENKDEEDERDCWFEDEYENEDDYNGIDSLVGFVDCVKDVLWKYGIYRPKVGEIRIVMWFDS